MSKTKNNLFSTNDPACLTGMKKEAIDYTLSNIGIGSTLGNIGVDIQFLIYEINSHSYFKCDGFKAHRTF